MCFFFIAGISSSWWHTCWWLYQSHDLPINQKLNINQMRISKYKQSKVENQRPTHNYRIFAHVHPLPPHTSSRHLSSNFFQLTCCVCVCVPSNVIIICWFASVQSAAAVGSHFRLPTSAGPDARAALVDVPYASHLIDCFVASQPIAPCAYARSDRRASALSRHSCINMYSVTRSMNFAPLANWAYEMSFFFVYGCVDAI